jgi:hypothetical protein
MVPSLLPRRIALLALALGCGMAGPALAGPRDRGAGREIHVTVRAKRLVIPPPLIEQVGAGQTRIEFPSTRGSRAIAFTMALVDGRYVVSEVEPLN